MPVLKDCESTLQADAYETFVSLVQFEWAEVYGDLTLEASALIAGWSPTSFPRI